MLGLYLFIRYSNDGVSYSYLFNSPEFEFMAFVGLSSIFILSLIISFVYVKWLSFRYDFTHQEYVDCAGHSDWSMGQILRWWGKWLLVTASIILLLELLSYLAS